MSQQIVFEVNGMKCGGCVTKVEEALRDVPGLLQVQIDLAGRSARVTGQVDAAVVIAALQKAGYPAKVKAG